MRFRICAFFVTALLVSSFNPRAKAGLPEPDIVVYGFIAIDGQPVTRADTEVVVEIRANAGGPLLADYRMGTIQSAGDAYLLRVKTQSAQPLEFSDSGALPLGDSIHLTLRDRGGMRDAQTLSPSTRGELIRLDIGIAQSNSNNGLFEQWKFAHNIQGDGTADQDGDGVSDAGEYEGGTDPNDSNDVFELLIQQDASGAGISFFARRAEGVGYTSKIRYCSVESSTSLNEGPWIPLDDLTDVVGNNQLVMRPITATNAVTFYRGIVRLYP